MNFILFLALTLLRSVFGKPIALNEVDYDPALTNTTSGFNPATGDALVSVKIDHTKTNVGDLRDSNLYGTIWHSLDLLCPYGSDRCNHHGAHFDTITMNVAYLQGHRLFHGPWLTFQIQQSYHKTDSLRRLMIGTIAATLQASAADAKNCVEWVAHGPPHWTKHGRHCNVPNIVTVAAGESNMSLRIRSKGDNGKFDCPAILAETNKAVDDLMGEYTTELGGAADKNVACI